VGLRVLVDARLLNGGGIGRYLRELCSRWLRDPRLESIRFLGRPSELESWLAEVDERGIGSIERWPDGPYSPVAQLRWPLAFWGARRAADVVFFPHYDVPCLAHPAPSVVTVHDLTHFRVPELFPAVKRWGGRLLLRAALSRATRLVTVSRFSRDDLVRWRPSIAEKLVVIPNGTSPAARPLSPEEQERALVRWGGYRPYLLAVGGFRPHKNLSLAIALLARLRRSHPDLRLLLAGPRDDHAARVEAEARAAGLGEAVVHVGPVADDQLRELYGLAEMLVFPSLYEGFGLPPLEAMACGTPVLVSNRGALPEVVGEAAPALDPGDVAAWEEEALRLLRDPALRARRCAAGQGRARLFSWDRSASETLEVLLRVAARGG
jgi:glycosyltransferase involved in cell wall biosynthesis